jgi:SAM-dependent methyltransferase
VNPVEVKNYWEDRLEKVFSLHGVGYAGLGIGFNRWMYKVRKHVFKREIGKHVPITAASKILDIGCGTGFYIDRWKDAGARDITGLDITNAVISNCSKKYPQYRFVKEDIGENSLAAPLGTFDVISAFDVLFHIVDEQRFVNALRNIASLAKPDGMFVMSDNFLHGRGITQGHQASRSLNAIENAVKDAGFEIVDRRPMFFLMNDPIDSNNAFIKLFWNMLARLVGVRNVVGSTVGCLLYPLELLLTAVTRESPTTEIMICRKRGQPEPGKAGAS